ncbi:hypothetical protein AAFF_G00227890 [Aldrovandia affinis]|uniref:Neogenin-like n=1 Tax=Aldrovandia affinis TaxID=143900 RepID=A0AAD7TBK1_9TELE|nr:hypothetical protein AAFF_G00227890 [Aldrovandia affinis]
MAEGRVRLFLSLYCLTCLCSGSAAPHADKGSAPMVFTPLWFSAEPADTLVVRGEAALLNCSVHSDAPVRVEWRKDGTFLNLASDDQRQLLADGSLLVTSVVRSRDGQADEGLYQCMASIPGLGTISSRYTQLTVTGLPRFSSQPEAASVQQGHSEVMTCGVNSDLVALVQWERNREAVWLDRRVVQLDSGALVVSNATEADAGMYRCMVGNAPAAQASEEAELQVLTETEVEEKLEFLQQPVPMTKVEGEHVLLPCVVTGFPLPEVWWMLGNRRIHESAGRFEVVGGGSLQILNMTAEDAGIYSCVANQGNDTIEAQAELTVHVPPRFLKRPASVYAHESTNVLFQCEATGTPPPTIHWLKDGDTVIPSDYFRILRGGDLQVQGLVQSDEGFYQCLAQNQAGNVQSSAQLIVLNRSFHGDAGLTPSAPRDVVASLVSTRFIKLTWHMPAEPHADGNDITYSVYYSQEGTNRERVLNSSHAGVMLEATVENLHPDRKYVFRVAAQSQAGLGESSNPLIVFTQAEVQVPGPAPNLQAGATSPTSISLSWDMPLSGNGETLTYRVYYMEKGLEHEQDLGVSGLSYTLTSLKKFTDYSLRVVAYNKNGPGVSTEGVSVRTLSDVPSTPPQNLTLEALNSQSMMVRWFPPPPGTENGELIGYRIRYRKSVRKSEVAEIAVGTKLFQLIDGLERGAEYTFRVAAVTINGTGAATDWVTAETFESDLDETQVPDMPSSLHVRPLVNSIVVSWTPPEKQDIVVRGYIIGYGIGSPHAQMAKVDYKQRYYTVKNLDSSSHYVITLKAFNNMGEGIPVYESAITRPQSAAEPTPMLPPVGVQASVLSRDAIKVTWADNSLPKSQKIMDARYYTVCWRTNIPANTKLKTTNTTSLSHVVAGLKPNTLYEFSVMVTRGRRSSTWSMTAQGTTLESVPSTSPKDVTVVSKEGRPRTIIINWQPPSEANGKITGYIIYYSTDVSVEVHSWVIEPVVGNRLTHQIQDLTLDTSYYIKLQARNAKGLSPVSTPVHFHTPKVELSDKMANDQASGAPAKPGSRGRPAAPDQGFGSAVGKPSVMGASDGHVLMVVVVVSVGVFTIMVVVGGAFLCTRHNSSQQKQERAVCKPPNASKYKSSCKDPKPPDMWIHHEHLELKPLENSPKPNPIIPHASQDITPTLSSANNPTHQRLNSQHGHESEDNPSALAGRRGPNPRNTDTQPSQFSVRSPPSTALPTSAPPVSTSERPEADSHSNSSALKGDRSPPPTVRLHPTHPLKSFATPSSSQPV